MLRAVGGSARQEHADLAPDLMHDVVDGCGRWSRPMLRNMIAETMWASVAASLGSMRRSRRNTKAIASSVCTVRREGVAVVGFLGVAEDHLSQVGPPVVDLDAVALHDRRTIAITARACRGWSRQPPALLERVGVVGVLHEQEQLPLGLGVEEQRARADSALSAICWVVTSSTPRTAKSSLAAAVMRSSFSCLFRSRRPTADGANRVMTISFCNI